MTARPFFSFRNAYRFTGAAQVVFFFGRVLHKYGYWQRGSEQECGRGSDWRNGEGEAGGSGRLAEAGCSFGQAARSLRSER